jgi:hypothetical protein
MSNAQIYIHSIDFPKFRMTIKSGTGLLKRAPIMMLDLSGGRFGVYFFVRRKGIGRQCATKCHDNLTPLTPSDLSCSVLIFMQYAY